MFKGFVLSESLNDPTILNKFDVIKVIVENHKEFKGEPKIWHDFKLKIKEKGILKTCKLISKQIKREWYAHFWNKRTLYVVLPEKVFKMPREDGKWKSSEYKKCKKYAMKQGVEEQYLTDFLIQD
ncbi:hypothetical protein HZA97_05640 [Candidatus Woesearchaeota archaeon]|nr:hypothetical protein [Candidatus Woesearchaeota archaeon]